MRSATRIPVRPFTEIMPPTIGISYSDITEAARQGLLAGREKAFAFFAKHKKHDTAEFLNTLLHYAARMIDEDDAHLKKAAVEIVIYVSGVGSDDKNTKINLEKTSREIINRIPPKDLAEQLYFVSRLLNDTGWHDPAHCVYEGFLRTSLHNVTLLIMQNPALEEHFVPLCCDRITTLARELPSPSPAMTCLFESYKNTSDALARHNLRLVIIIDANVAGRVPGVLEISEAAVANFTRHSNLLIEMIEKKCNIDTFYVGVGFFADFADIPHVNPEFSLALDEVRDKLCEEGERLGLLPFKAHRRHFQPPSASPERASFH